MALSGTVIHQPDPPPSFNHHTIDADGLPTVHELPHYKTNYEIDNRSDPPSLSMRGRTSSRDASINSSIGRSYMEKETAAVPPPVPYTRHLRSPSDAPSSKLKKADRRRTVAAQYDDLNGAERPKRSGLRQSIRRMFTRKSAKGRISMPTGPLYRQHNPEEFMTSATDLENQQSTKTERSASLPTNAFLRSSGLSSHPPFQPQAIQLEDEPPLPHNLERNLSEKPIRPHRASVPSETFNKDEMQAVTEAMSGIGLPINQAQNTGARDIGYAVTNDSQPKRRSRSAGASGERGQLMEPIQWRHHRTKSDEGIYSRDGADFASFVKRNDDLEMLDSGRSEIVDGSIEAKEGEQFNFELQEDGIQDQERIGVEERLVTLEIKLMDLEYALSKLQVGSALSSRRHSRSEPVGQRSVESYRSSNVPSIPNTSPTLNHNLSRFSAHQSSSESASVRKDRPTSVAGTLRPGHHPLPNSFSKPQADSDNRMSFSGLTVEHYSTLVTLLRNEQSARIRLEEQVTELQQKIEKLQPASFSYHHSSHASHTHTLSNQSHRLGTMNADGRRGGKYYVSRPRSSSYSTNETDTEDENYHDAYVTPSNVTPVERGEYEGANYNGEPF
ncbi:uncharacterized protein KY384_008385 [Bacidia gigantensis]|uniref:uncharacterized protein n=1 Tax=Bacidia gigantensis TaxID=2732470 RepID=UPI001D049054|nr:uncharacterized protein KY384_008385 [Bacidia gigantensis]KAG8526956.1 hypothetical protein KY384_008385 [Bacidia gigantensis]